MSDLTVFDFDAAVRALLDGPAPGGAQLRVMRPNFRPDEPLDTGQARERVRELEAVCVTQGMREGQLQISSLFVSGYRPIIVTLDREWVTDCELRALIEQIGKFTLRRDPLRAKLRIVG